MNKQISNQQKQSFDIICSFLSEQGEIDRAYLYKKYLNGIVWNGIPNPPKTVNDPVTVFILEQKIGKSAKELVKTRKWVNAVEASVGHLLERYIHHKTANHGWAWCAGSVVKATDFLKKTNDGWIQIQVKNRDNTENSSSCAIRDGTKIKKWFRLFSKTGKTNWESLPLLMGENCGMSEDDFFLFVESTVCGSFAHKKSCLDV